MQDNRDNVELMTSVFRYAMTFEKYVKIWSDSLSYVNKLLKSNSINQANAFADISREEITINDIDDNYAAQMQIIKKDVKKYKIKVALIISIVLALLILGIALFTINAKAGIVFFILIFGGILPIIVVFSVIYFLHKSHRRKQDRNNYTVERKEHQKLVSTNNIKALKTFSEKLKAEEKLLYAKKEKIEKEYKEAKRILSEIYALELIPPIYRGLVPTATIYGYLVNGRCTIIRGHGGVYDTYENDLRAELIINNLMDINKKLDIVIQNQNKLYELVGSISTTLIGIKSEVERNGQTLREINRNSAIAATAQQQSAAAQQYIASQIWRNS